MDTIPHRRVFAALFALSLAAPAGAQPPAHIWSRGWSGAGYHAVSAIDEAGDGSIAIVGEFWGSIDLGTGLLTSLGMEDVYVARLDSDGHAIWSRGFGAEFTESATDVAFDSQGNVVVTGTFRSSVDFGGIVRMSAGLSDAYVAKFDVSGNLLWVNSYGSTVFDAAAGVDIGPSDNIFVTGNFEGNVDFGLGTLNGAGQKDIFVLKLDPDGNALVTQRYGGPFSDSGSDIEVFGSGSFVLGGTLWAGTDLGGGVIASTGGLDPFVAQYNANFFHQWSVVGGGPSSDSGRDVARDLNGSVYLTGGFLDTANFGGGTLMSNGSSDLFLAKFDSAGNHQWSQNYGSELQDVAFGMDCDLFGNTTIVGYVQDEVSFGGATFGHEDGEELFMAGFDPNGLHRWSRVNTGLSSDQCRSVHMSLEGQLLVGGFFYEPQDLGGGIFSEFVGEMFLVKYRAPTVEPFILGIEDVENDQGRSVRLRLQRSTFDEPGSPAPVVYYEAYRRDDPLPTKMAGWDYVGSVPAHGDEEYQLIVPTLADSTLAQGMHWSVFVLRATTDDPYVFIESEPDSGYSMDNLAPSVPQGLNLQSGSLSWQPAPEPDFDYFTVYGSFIPQFDGSATPLGHRVDPAMDVEPAAYDYYYITSTDFSGNESSAAGLEALVGISDSPRPRALGLRAFPNPFNPSTQIELRLPASAEARVEIFDVSGRRIRTLLRSALPAGPHLLRWDGRDALGQVVASGLYFARVRAGANAATEKLVLLK